MPFDVAPFCCDHFPCHAEWDRIAEDMGIWRLSPAETWRTRRLIAGHSEESIARDEGLSVGIVRAEDAALYAKLGVRSREELIAMARAAHDKRLAEGNPPGGCPRRHPAARMMAAEEIRVGSLFVESRMAAVKFALRLAGNRKELAEEIVAAAWFLAVSNWQTYDRAKPFRPWLFQIMCHALYHMNHCAEQAEGGGAPDCPVLAHPTLAQALRRRPSRATCWTSCELWWPRSPTTRARCCTNSFGKTKPRARWPRNKATRSQRSAGTWPESSPR